MKYGDRIKVTSSSTGTGNLTISGTALDSYFAFSTLKGSGLIPVVIEHSVTAQNESELSLCTLSGTTLTRVKCCKSTNGDAFVNFSSGTKYVFVDYQALINYPGCNLLKTRAIAGETASNKTLSTLVPGLSFNGVTLAALDVIFLNAQTDQKENGPWIVQASGSPVRPLWFYTDDIAESIQLVGNDIYVCSSPTAVIGTNNITFVKIGTISGPTSSTDNALPRWDGTDGRTLQNSGVTINDSDKIKFKTSYSDPVSQATSGTVTLDLDTSNFHKVTASGGNVTLAVSNVSVNQPFFLTTKQDATGSRTWTWFANINWPGGVTPTPVATANHWDNWGFICTGLDGYGDPVFDGFILGRDYR